MGYAVRYDLDTGLELSSLLAQLNEKLASLAQLRGRLKSSDLDATPGNWTGGAYSQFSSQYGAQESQLMDLAERAITIKGQVDDANTLASRSRFGGGGPQPI